MPASAVRRSARAPGSAGRCRSTAVFAVSVPVETLNGKPGLQRDDAVGLPLGERALQDRVGDREERDVVNERGHKAVADVPVRVAVIGLPPVWIHGRASAVGVGGDIQRVRPGVAGQHLQAVRHALAEDDAHALVVGDFVVGDGADGAKQRIRPARVDGARSGKQRRVVVEAAVQVIGMRAEILHLERRRRSTTGVPGRRSTDSCGPWAGARGR